MCRHREKAAIYVEETELPKHLLYTDVGLCGARINLGLSATYNYKVLPWLGIGVGAQAYDFFPTVCHDHRYVPAVYGDLQFYIRPRKKGQFLAFIDIGKDFYSSSDEYVRQNDFIYYVPLKNGGYFGLGIGYFRAVTKRGWGVYTTLKLISNFYKPNVYNIETGEKYISAYDRGTAVLSFGFRF